MSQRNWFWTTETFDEENRCHSTVNNN